MRVDANVVLRHLLDDHPEHAPKAHQLFAAAAAGHQPVTLEEITLAETVWTLSSYYRLRRREITDALLELLQPTGIRCEHKDEIQLALALYGTHNIDFADALLAAKALSGGDREIVSFDRDFDQVPGVLRREPA